MPLESLGIILADRNTLGSLTEQVNQIKTEIESRDNVIA